MAHDGLKTICERGGQQLISHMYSVAALLVMCRIFVLAEFAGMQVTWSHESGQYAQYTVGEPPAHSQPPVRL